MGKLTRAQAEQIAKAKMPDLTAADLEAAVRTVAGSARSMGVEVEGILTWLRFPSASRRCETKVDRTKAYPVADAIKLVKENATAKFNESIDVAVNLGVDAKKSDQVVRGSLVLPQGTGKTRACRRIHPGRAGQGGQGGWRGSSSAWKIWRPR